jgi:hypothetical protein
MRNILVITYDPMCVCFTLLQLSTRFCSVFRGQVSGCKNPCSISKNETIAFGYMLRSITNFINSEYLCRVMSLAIGIIGIGLRRRVWALIFWQCLWPQVFTLTKICSNIVGVWQTYNTVPSPSSYHPCHKDYYSFSKQKGKRYERKTNAQQVQLGFTWSCVLGYGLVWKKAPRVVLCDTT